MTCNLVQIQSLILSDTFYTWYDRTNQIISAINPVQIYDISLGATSGLSGFTPSCTAGILNIRVVPGPGIGVGSIGYNLGNVQVDMSQLPIVATSGYDNAVVSSRPSTSFLSNEDWFAVSDNSDTTLNTGAGTPKRISADRILPPTVYLPNGFAFNGDITVNGNLTIAGTASNLDSNDLRIEDRLIELAYARLVGVDITGPTYGQPASFYQGANFFYYDPGEGNTAAYTTAGKISSISYRGLTSSLQLHNFTFGGVSDIVNGGRISLTGTNFDFSIVAGPTTVDAFLTDTQLDESGIRIRGSQSDKYFIWESGYNAFISSGPSGFPISIGVSGSTAGVVSSKFRSYGYGGAGNEYNNKFHFVGQTGEATIRIGGLGETSFATNLAEQYGYWSITKSNSTDLGGTGQYQPLVFGFKQHGRTGPARTEFIIWPSASGSSYTTVSVTGSASRDNTVFNFAQGLNVDMLDGAHALTASTPWQIPVALASGKISSDWIETQSIIKCYAINNHGFRVGDVIRAINTGPIGFTGAKADTPANAEAIGMVSVVTDANNFCVVTEGFISGLTGATANIGSILPLVTGSTYFLSATGSVGRLVLDPDSPGPNQIPINGVRKPVFQALGVDSGYVRAYQGEVLFEPTDMIDIDGFQPVGVISPFVGPTAQIPTGWLLCDGNKVNVSQWTDLYNMIGQEFYAQGVTSNALTGGLRDIQVSMDGGTRNLSVNDAVRVQSVISGLTNASVDTYVSQVQNNIVTFKDFLGGTGATGFLVTGRIDATYTSTFFLPDIRRRVLVGSTRGLTSTSLNSLYPNIKIGDLGGSNLKTLIENNIPAHEHRLKKLTGLGTTSGSLAAGAAITGGITAAGGYLTDAQTDSGADNIFTAQGPVGSQGQPFDSMPDYLTVNWIIRGLRGMRARILTGHQHDDRYIRYDMAQSLGVTNRNLFRINSKTLGDGADGGATFNSAKFTFASGSSVDIFAPITATGGITASRAFISTLTADRFFFTTLTGQCAFATSITASARLFAAQASVPNGLLVGGVTSSAGIVTTSLTSSGLINTPKLIATGVTTTSIFTSTITADKFSRFTQGISAGSVVATGLTTGTFKATLASQFDANLTANGHVHASGLFVANGLTATSAHFGGLVRFNSLTGPTGVVFAATGAFDQIYGGTAAIGPVPTDKRKYRLEVGGQDGIRLHADQSGDNATNFRVGTSESDAKYLQFLNGDSNGAYSIKVGGLLVSDLYALANPIRGNAVVQRHLAIGNGGNSYTYGEGITTPGFEVNGYTKVTPLNGVAGSGSNTFRHYRDCFSYVHSSSTNPGPFINGITSGSMMIVLPYGPADRSTMMKIKIKGGQYTEQSGTWETDLYMYPYTVSDGGMSIIRRVMRTSGRCPFSDVSVGLTITGSEWGNSPGGKQKLAIILGGTHCNWAYPQIHVSDFSVNLSSQDGWAKGWTGGIRSDYSSIDMVRGISRFHRRGLGESITGNFTLNLIDGSNDNLDVAPTTLYMGVETDNTHTLKDPANGNQAISRLFGGIHLFGKGAVNNTYTGITTRSQYPYTTGYAQTNGGILFQSNNTFGTKIHFYTSEDSISGMRHKAVLDAAGRFGIGLTSPDAKLEVVGDAIITSSLSVNSSGATAEAGIGLGISGPISMNPPKRGYAVSAAAGSGFPERSRVYNNVCMWEPDDGQLYGTGRTAGTLVIKSPKGWSQTQLQLFLKGSGLNDESWNCTLYGYARTGGAGFTASWISPSILSQGSTPFEGNVRFDYIPSEDRTVILLGVTGTNWYYTNVYLDQVVASFDGQENYGSGWDMYLSQGTVPPGITGNSYTRVPSDAGNEVKFHGMMELKNGNFGIGITAPSQRLAVNGAIVSSGDMTALSDARLKSNIVKIDNSLNRILSLNGVLYTDREGKRRTGLIAQDVEKVLPEAVYGDETTQYSLAYGNLVGLLVEGIKTLNTKVNDLSVEVASLKSELSELKSEDK